MDRWLKEKKYRKSSAPEAISKTKRSSWTELNKERARRLEKIGLMTAEGIKALPNLDLNAYNMDEVIVKKLMGSDQVYENFMRFPELYRRIRVDTINRVKNQPELFERRLDKLINNTSKGKMYGAWNDNGRLLNY